MDSRGQVWGELGGGGRGNGPAVLAHLPSAPSCLLHNKAAVSNCQMFTLPAHSPGIVALAGTHRRVELFYFIYYYLKKKRQQNSVPGKEPSWPGAECRNIPSLFCARNYFCFL